MILSPMILAENGIEIKIVNDSISVRGYTNDPIYGKVDFGFFNKIDEQMNNSIVCDNVMVEVNGTNTTYQENCRIDFNYNKDIPIFTQNESTTAIMGDTGLWKELQDCVTLKAQYSAGLASCVENKLTMTDASTNITQCSTDIQICRSDKSNLDIKVSSLEKDIEDNKNRQWWFGILGLVIGGVIIMIKEGKLGGTKIKKEEDYFNPRQAS